MTPEVRQQLKCSALELRQLVDSYLADKISLQELVEQLPDDKTVYNYHVGLGQKLTVLEVLIQAGRIDAARVVLSRSMVFTDHRKQNQPLKRAIHFALVHGAETDDWDIFDLVLGQVFKGHWKKILVDYGLDRAAVYPKFYETACTPWQYFKHKIGRIKSPFITCQILKRYGVSDQKLIHFFYPLHMEIVMYLLSHQTVNSKIDGWTLLCQAAKRGSTNDVAILLHHRANIEIPSKATYPWQYCLPHKNLDLLDILFFGEMTRESLVQIIDQHGIGAIKWCLTKGATVYDVCQILGLPVFPEMVSMQVLRFIC